MIKLDSLPDDWSLVKLQDIVEIYDNQRIPLNSEQRSRMQGIIPYCGANGVIDYLNDFIFDGEYLLVAEDGGFFGYMENTSYIMNGKFWANNHVHVLKSIKGKTFNKYLEYYLNSIDFGKYTSGTTRKKLNQTKLKTIEVILPPLNIQKKIVEILEKAKKLKEWRVEADELSNEYLKSVFLEMFGDPVKNEKSWKKVKLSELGTWKSGGTPSRQKKEFFTGNIPWYTSGELNNMYILDSVENITEEAIENSNAKLIKPNSLLLGMYDTAALKSSITTIDSSCNQAIAFSELENYNSNIIYVYYAIQIGRKYFMSRQRGIRQKNLNLTMVKDTEIPLPPLELQNQFAQIVQKVEDLKNYQSQSKQEIDNLFNTLMQKAFKGELIC